MSGRPFNSPGEHTNTTGKHCLAASCCRSSMSLRFFNRTDWGGSGLWFLRWPKAHRQPKSGN